MLESILIRFILWLSRKLPAERSLWSEALLAEAAAIRATEERLQWLAGGVVVALRSYAGSGIKKMTTDLDGQRLPAVVLLIALYQCVFSLALVGLLVFQLPRVRESWTDAVPALSISLLLAIVPSVLGFGLFILDDAARWGTLVFSIAHALLAWHRISNAAVNPIFPEIRIAFDGFILTTLMLPVIVRRFHPRPIELNLR